MADSIINGLATEAAPVSTDVTVIARGAANAKKVTLAALVAAGLDGNLSSIAQLTGAGFTYRSSGSPTWEVLGAAAARTALGIDSDDAVTFGNITVGANADAAQRTIDINAAAGQTRALRYMSGGVVRWSAFVTSAAETGSDAGSAWVLRANTDAGALIDDPITITRAAGGSMVLTRPITASAAFTGSISVTSPQMVASGNVSAAAWTTAGIGFKAVASTYTDTSSSGTVSVVGVHALATPTLAASSSTTYTTASTLYIAAAPTAGTNVTITTGRAIHVAAGSCLFAGGITVQGATNLNVNQNNATSIGTGTTTSAVSIGGASNAVNISSVAGGTLGFHGATAVAIQTISGSRGGNAALADLLTKLATKGLIVDGTTA